MFDFVFSLTWQRRVFLDDLLKTDDIPRSLSDVEVVNKIMKETTDLAGRHPSHEINTVEAPVSGHPRKAEKVSAVAAYENV